MNRITLTADICPISGYGMHAIAIARDLSRIVPSHVAIRPLGKAEMFGCKIPTDIRARFVSAPQPEPWEILLHPPNFAPTPGKKTVYSTMWESTKLPPMGPMVLNKAEVVVCPTWWNASCFSANGVQVPIRVVPLGIYTDVFSYSPMQSLYHPTFKAKCVFGTAGRMAHGGVRKGINEVIHAFQKAFPTEDDVVLKVKVFPDCPVEHVKDPRIEIIQAMLTDQEMADWLRSLTCFVSAATGEGFGLIQLQALAVGRPIISVEFGGITTFFNEDVGYPVKFSFDPAKLNYSGCGNWATPSEDHMIHLMQHIRNNRDEAEAKGALAASRVAHLSWENSNRKLAEVLKEFGVI